MKKRVLSLTLAVLLALSLLPVAAFAVEGDFVIKNGVLMEYTGSGGDVVIPNGVTRIESDVFLNNAFVTSITIPNSVTEIGENAFYGCTNLTSLTLPDSLTEIGVYTFACCYSLTSVTIPDSVIEIGNGAFSQCKSLTSVTIGNSVTTIGESAFAYCNSLSSVTIPSSVTTIGDETFSHCVSLTSVTILDSVTRIGDHAFSYCSALTSVTLGNSVTSIGSAAFKNCSKLTDVYYGGSKEQWLYIPTGNDNQFLTVITVHFAACASTQSVLVDGKSVEFQCYALKDANGNDTNYIKLRDVANVLNGTAAQFNVGWDGNVNIETGRAYVPNGSEMSTPFSGNRTYENATATTNINGSVADLNAIVLKDDTGAGFTYYELRDLGNALGFKVDWSNEKGIFIETK